jgi:hypothetical protein
LTLHEIWSSSLSVGVYVSLLITAREREIECGEISLVTLLLEWFYSLCGPWPLFQFPDLFTIGRTPWTSDQHVPRPLPKHRTTQTQNKCTQYCTDTHALSGIRTHDPSVRASEDSSRPRPRGHSDRQLKASASQQIYRHGVTACITTHTLMIANLYCYFSFRLAQTRDFL